MRGGYVAKYGLVNRTRHREFEIWVVAELHVREILMRQCLQDRRRDVWHPRFGIIAVPKFAPRPRHVVRLTQISDYARQKYVGEIGRRFARKSGWVYRRSVSILRRANA